MKRRPFFFAFILMLCLAAPLIASAQGNLTLPAVTVTPSTNCPPAANGFVPLACAPTGQVNNLYSQNNLSGYINAIFTIALSVGAMLAVLRLVYAGYIYMLKDSFSLKQNAKEIIGNTIFGLLLLLAIWLILDQIDPSILNLNITFPNSGTTATPAQSTSSTAPSSALLAGCIAPTQTDNLGDMCQTGYTMNSSDQCCPQ